VGSLTPALRDRARVVRPVKIGPRVEGRTLVEPTHGEWFPARLIVTTAREVEDNGRRRVVEAGELVCATDDVRTSDAIEVESATLGSGRWQVAGTVQVAQTRRPTLAVVIPVERVLEPPVAESIAS
jgi:hypothetical protein